MSDFFLFVFFKSENLNLFAINQKGFRHEKEIINFHNMTLSGK